MEEIQTVSGDFQVSREPSIIPRKRSNKKWVLLLIFMLILGVLGTLVFLKSETIKEAIITGNGSVTVVNWETYANKDYYFQIRYPANIFNIDQGRPATGSGFKRSNKEGLTLEVIGLSVNDASKEYLYHQRRIAELAIGASDGVNTKVEANIPVGKYSGGIYLTEKKESSESALMYHLHTYVDSQGYWYEIDIYGSEKNKVQGQTELLKRIAATFLLDAIPPTPLPTPIVFTLPQSWSWILPKLSQIDYAVAFPNDWKLDYQCSEGECITIGKSPGYDSDSEENVEGKITIRQTAYDGNVEVSRIRYSKSAYNTLYLGMAVEREKINMANFEETWKYGVLTESPIAPVATESAQGYNRRIDIWGKKEKRLVVFMLESTSLESLELQKILLQVASSYYLKEK